jgi:hypothetical protein
MSYLAREAKPLKTYDVYRRVDLVPRTLGNVRTKWFAVRIDALGNALDTIPEGATCIGRFECRTKQRAVILGRGACQ